MSIARIRAAQTVRQARRDELAEIAAIWSTSAGYGDRTAFMIDPSVVRGLEYYTGPVYEVELTARNQGRERPPRPLRLGRRRRALRRPRLALSRRAGAGDRILHRRVAAAGGADLARQARQQARARPGGGHRVRPRPHRRLPAHGRGAARRRHPRRALSRLQASSARR